MTNRLFTIVPDVKCILRSNGSFKQVDVYERLNQLYAGTGAACVMLYADGRTSKPNTRWQDIVGINPKTGEFDRLLLK